MNQEVRDLICAQRDWTYTTGGEFKIRFNSDGTGELVAIGELGVNWLIAGTTTWKTLPLPRPAADILNDDLFKHINPVTRRPGLIGCVQLEIVLEAPIPDRLLDGYRELDYTPSYNEEVLTEAAYLPRQFTVVVEKGSFAAVRDSSGLRELRMTFDTSPYPKLDGYKTTNRYGDPRDRTWVYEMLSESRAFYASEVPSNARATEDDCVMGYHMSNCVML